MLKKKIIIIYLFYIFFSAVFFSAGRIVSVPAPPAGADRRSDNTDNNEQCYVHVSKTCLATISVNVVSVITR